MTSAPRVRSLAAGITGRAAHVFAALCAAAFLFSLHRYALYRYQPRSYASLPLSAQWRISSAALGIGGGAVRVMRWYCPAQVIDPAPPNLLGWFSGRYEEPTVWWIQGFNSPHSYRAYPIWMFALAGYTPRLLVAGRDRLRIRRRRCHACAYDLRGLPTRPDGRATCPECGAACAN